MRFFKQPKSSLASIRYSCRSSLLNPMEEYTTRGTICLHGRRHAFGTEMQHTHSVSPRPESMTNVACLGVLHLFLLHIYVLRLFCLLRGPMVYRRTCYFLSTTNNNNNNINKSIFIAPWFQVTLFKGAVTSKKTVKQKLKVMIST